jgi:5,10-methenyltetrahydrofolate synthetase
LERRAWRERLIAAREALDDRTHRQHSAAILGCLSGWLQHHMPRILAFYSPHRLECDLTPVALAVIEAGGEAALPVVQGRSLPLEFRRWRPGVAMTPGPYRIPQPVGEPLLRPDLVLAPLVGFDEAGYRLGYGGGYYDRTLAALVPRPVVIGVGFEIGRLTTIVAQPHDVRMDAIVTEAGFFAITDRIEPGQAR